MSLSVPEGWDDREGAPNREVSGSSGGENPGVQSQWVAVLDDGRDGGCDEGDTNEPGWFGDGGG